VTFGLFNLHLALTLLLGQQWSVEEWVDEEESYINRVFAA
jgi:hypothetical protein